MLVVADTSPIHVLVRLAHVEVLPGLFQRVVVPTMVARELAQARYEQVCIFMATPPAWLYVQEPQVIERIPAIHPGEEAAISLARELAADVLLIDDYEGRRAATRRGVPILGTLGVLERAATVGLLQLEDVIDRIRQTDFRVSDELIQAILDRHRRPPSTDKDN
jgi:predicted nucleic acid-binding protein